MAKDKTAAADPETNASDAGANPGVAIDEAGDVRTSTRVIEALNNSSTLLSLEDGTPFPRNRTKWLTEGEAERFNRLGVIAIRG